MLDLRGDPIELTAALVDIPSESRHEAVIADAVEAALRAQTTGFEIIRDGNAVLARTDLGRPSRVLLAGHLDTRVSVTMSSKRGKVVIDFANLEDLERIYRLIIS